MASMGRTVRVVAGLALLVGTLACGCTSFPWQFDDDPLQGPTKIDDPAPIVAMRDRLAAGPAEYTATYTVAVKGIHGPEIVVTVTRSAAGEAIAGPAGRFVRTPNHALYCGTTAGRIRCQRSGPTVDPAVAAAAVVAVAGTSLVSQTRTVELLGAAATAKVGVRHDRDDPPRSDCVSMESGKDFPAPRLFEVTPYHILVVCRTDDNVLSSVYGEPEPRGGTGKPSDVVELTGYQLTADPVALAPPQGAPVRAVDRIDLAG